MNRIAYHHAPITIVSPTAFKCDRCETTHPTFTAAARCHPTTPAQHGGPRW